MKGRNVVQRLKIHNHTYYKKNLTLKQKFICPKVSRIIAASLFLASVSLLAIFGLEDSRVEDVDGSVVPQRSRYGLGGLDSRRQ